MITINDNLVLPEDGTGAISVNAGEDARAFLPDLIAVEIVSCDEHLLLIEKADEDGGSVCHRSAGCSAVFTMHFFDGSIEHGFLPNSLT